MQSERQSCLNDFQILNKLGEGSFSSVYRVKRLSDGLEYAMKKVKMGQLKEKEKENALNEVRILASINEQYIVSYKEAFIDEDSKTLCIVMELAQEGDLLKKITDHQKKGTTFTEKEVWKAAFQLCKGLKTLHDLKIVHRDLKCANIFISQNSSYKLGDLNGTPYYASPEIWRDEPYDKSSDIWSLGCVLYEMAALRPPFRAQDMEGLYRKIQKGVFEKIPQRYSNDLQNMISGCLKMAPSQRLTCEQIINNSNLQKNLQDVPQEEQKVVNNNNDKKLLQTIKMPKNFNSLKERLPKANYGQIDNRQVNRSIDVDRKFENNVEIEKNFRINYNSNQSSGSNGPVQRTNSASIQKKDVVVEQKRRVQNPVQNSQETQNSKPPLGQNQIKVVTKEKENFKEVLINQRAGKRSLSQRDREQKDSLDNYIAMNDKVQQRKYSSKNLPPVPLNVLKQEVQSPVINGNQGQRQQRWGLR